MITVVMACYNQEKYIEQAVKSVLNQTYENFDIIIVNDGSTDGSQEKIEELSKLDTRISFIKTDDIGATMARSTAVDLSDQPYFVPLDGDDHIAPSFLEETLRVLDGNSGRNYGFCYTDSIFYNEDTKFKKDMLQPDYNFSRLLMGNYICYCSLIRKKAFYDAGGYNRWNFNYFEDYELWIRMGRKGHYGAHIGKPLFYYRMRGNNLSANTTKFATIYKAFIIRTYPELYDPNFQIEVDKILEKYPTNFMSLKPKEQNRIYERIERNA